MSGHRWEDFFQDERGSDPSAPQLDQGGVHHAGVGQVFMSLKGLEQNLFVHSRSVMQQVDEAITVLLHFGQIAASLDDDCQSHQQKQAIRYSVPPEAFASSNSLLGVIRSQAWL